MSALSFSAALNCLLFFVAYFVLQPLAHAQTSAVSPPKTQASAAKSAVALTAAQSKPSWAELNPLQQQSLKPLSTSWSSLSEGQKLKWLEVSKGYPNLSAADQAMMHSRMNEWVAMSPQQRAAARLNFAKTKELSSQLTADEKKAKWQAYQALSPEDKASLAAKASPKPSGAATAVKPVEPQKLVIKPKGAESLPNAAPGAPLAPAK